MRKILGAHSKTAKEFLYLETGAIPLRFIIMSRRMSYLHHIVTRNEHELIYKFFKAQERRSIKDDWVTKIDEDKKQLDLKMSNEEISNYYLLNSELVKILFAKSKIFFNENNCF